MGLIQNAGDRIRDSITQKDPLGKKTNLELDIDKESVKELTRIGMAKLCVGTLPGLRAVASWDYGLAYSSAEKHAGRLISLGDDEFFTELRNTYGLLPEAAAKFIEESRKNRNAYRRMNV